MLDRVRMVILGVRMVPVIGRCGCANKMILLCRYPLDDLLLLH